MTEGEATFFGEAGERVVRAGEVASRPAGAAARVHELRRRAAESRSTSTSRPRFETVAGSKDPSVPGGGRRRWTSPASSATVPDDVADQQPPGVVDADRLAAALGPADRAALERVALAPGGDDGRLVGGQPALERAQERVQRGLEVGRRAAERARGGRAARAGSRRVPAATLRPMPSTAQPSWGRPSTRMPATLRPSTSTSLGHLMRGGVAHGLGHGDAGLQRDERGRIDAQHEREQQGAARRRRPCAALAPAARGLLGGGDQGAVRRAGGGERAGALVGRVGAAQVQARLAEAGAHGSARRRSSESGRRASSRAALPRLTATRERAPGVLVDEQLAGGDVGEGHGVVGPAAASGAGLDQHRAAQPQAGLGRGRRG